LAYTKGSSMNQLSLLDGPVIVDSTPIPLEPQQRTCLAKSLEHKPIESSFNPGDLVVPKVGKSRPVPLFPDQVCEVVRMGQSLGRDRAFVVSVKWKSRGVPAFPCDPMDLLLLSPAGGAQ